MTSLTRGTLPPGVYWRRRLAVVGIVVLLVVGVSRMLGGGSGDSGEKAANVSAPSSATGSPTPTPTSSTTVSSGPAGPGAAPSSTVAAAPTVTTPPVPTTPPPLPEPTGRCSDDDVVVTPSVTDAQATRTVLVRLTLRTLVTTACTWHSSPKALQVKITSGSDRIWSTIDCPHAVPTQDVVVRRDTDTVVNVGWSSRRSDEDCSSHTKWAMPGYYHVTVAALGGEPQDVQFALTKPRPLPKPTPTRTPPATTAPPAAPPAASTTGPRQEPQTPPKKKRKHRLVD